MTVNLMREQQNDILTEARALFDVLKDAPEAEVRKTADDLLVFCYRLHDRYVILRSSNPRFKGPTFAILGDVIYQLESKPDETLTSPEWREFLRSLVEDIVTGRIVVSKRK
jgi:hypothetical protein